MIRKLLALPLFWPCATLALLIVLNAGANPGFLAIAWRDGHLYGNLIDILNRAAPLALVAAGMTLVIAARGLDISVGAVVAIAAATGALCVSATGSLGLAGSIMAGEALCAAQAQHGSAPDIAGQDRANPTSLILSAAMLLEWLGENRKSENLVRAGKAIDAAVDKVLSNRETRTADLGGKLGTRAFGEAVAAAL